MRLIGIVFITMAITVAALSLSRSLAPKADEPVPMVTVPESDIRQVYVGAWVQGFWENDQKKLNTKVLTDFEAIIGGKVAFANIYADWQYLTNPKLLIDLHTISDNGWVPIVSSNPQFFKGCSDTGVSLYKTIADGKCDTFLRTVGDNLREYGKPVFFRFAWEMNLPNMYWSISKLKSTPDEFVAAWQRFHTVVRGQGATNVVWVLSFLTTNSVTVPYKDLYPGDDYVDWVALDGYNWGTAQKWSKWTNFDGVFWKSYKELTDLTHKPVMLSEVNSASVGGDKAAWLTNMLETEIPESYPGVAAIVFFNENKMQGENVDWRIERSGAFVEAVREGLNNPLYRRTYP